MCDNKLFIDSTSLINSLIDSGGKRSSIFLPGLSIHCNTMVKMFHSTNLPLQKFFYGWENLSSHQKSLKKWYKKLSIENSILTARQSTGQDHAQKVDQQQQQMLTHLPSWLVWP